MKKFILSAIALAFSVSLFAQEDLTSLYNEAAAAYGKKQFSVAATNFEKVITLGMDDESAGSMVATAKTYLPKCFYMTGGGAIRTKQYDVALANFTKAAEYAELYDDAKTMMQAKQWIGKVYQIQGGEAYNSKDYAAAKEVFSKGFEADPKNTEMANWLGTCYCETGEFEAGMNIFYQVVAMGKNPKYQADAEEATKLMGIYTNNRVAALQAENNFDGVIAMAEWILNNDAESAVAKMVRLQAYSGKKDYANVIATAEETAAAQTTPEEVSNVYFILAAAHNAQEQRESAIAAFKKVTAGPNAEAAAAALAELQKAE